MIQISTIVPRPVLAVLATGGFVLVAISALFGPEITAVLTLGALVQWMFLAWLIMTTRDPERPSFLPDPSTTFLAPFDGELLNPPEDDGSTISWSTEVGLLDVQILRSPLKGRFIALESGPESSTPGRMIHRFRIERSAGQSCEIDMWTSRPHQIARLARPGQELEPGDRMVRCRFCRRVDLRLPSSLVGRLHHEEIEYLTSGLTRLGTLVDEEA